MPTGVEQDGASADAPTQPEQIEAADRSQIAERLRWSPAQRLRYLLDMLGFEALARRARRVDGG